MPLLGVVSALATACGPQDTARAEPGTPGAGGSADGAGLVGAGATGTTMSGGGQVGTMAGSAATGAGSATGSTGSVGTGTTSPGAPAGSSGAPLCPTYQDDFVPQVYEPVCSKCHDGSNSKAPNWGQYSVASASCASIGDLVASGAMPPSSARLPLDAAQKALVAAWVGLGCPQDASALPASCRPSTSTSSQGPGYPQPASGSGGSAGTSLSGAGGAPPSTGASQTVTLAVTRAEWDADKQSLRLEGTVSDVTATLTAEFGGRTEALANDAGRFRNEFANVVSDPATVTVRTASGATTTASVTAK